jgi:hypothetical protein
VTTLTLTTPEPLFVTSTAGLAFLLVFYVTESRTGSGA